MQLCRACRRVIASDAAVCRTCGIVLRHGGVTYEVLLPHGRRVRVLETTTIGRAECNTIVLDDPSVSRHHARIYLDGGRALIEDACSSYGTFVDGHAVDGPSPLRDGARIQVGDTRLTLERRRAQYLSGRTEIVSTPGTLTGLAPDHRPRLRPGLQLKRLDADEGAQRYVIRDPAGRTYLRLDEPHAALVRRCSDGRVSLAELRAEASRRFGAQGEVRLMWLISDLADAGLLVGVAGTEDERGRLARAARPREWATDKAGRLFARLYDHGGWMLLSRPSLAVIATLVIVGLPLFVFDGLRAEHTPLLVANSVSWGALAFLAGRLALVVAHEAAHGLMLTAVGRSVSRGGLRFVFVIPYAFVDTSDAWFERRSRRMAVAAAGPTSDLALGGLCSVLAASLAGTRGEVAYQVALAAYLGAFFNLNPLLDRDGYHLLIDALDEPDLRRRSRAALARRIGAADDVQNRPEPDDRLLRRYALAGLAWSLVGAAWAWLLLDRHRPQIEDVLGSHTTSAITATVCALLVAPAGLLYGGPVWTRLRGGLRR